MLYDDFYAEVGGSYTRLRGKVFGDYEIKGEKTSLSYLEVAKRWKNSFGTIDTTFNIGKVFHDFVKDEVSYGLGMDYYPTNSSKLGYTYQNEKNNITSNYLGQYNFFFIEYTDNLSLNTYQVNVGVKISFDDLFDTSTWKSPTNIKPHLSELHRFENVAFSNNMNVQSNVGVQKTASAKARDSVPISNPTISFIDRNFDDQDGKRATSIRPPTATGVQSGAVYSLLSTVPGLTINTSDGSMVYKYDVLQYTKYNVTVKVTNPDGGSDTITFLLDIFDTSGKGNPKSSSPAV